MRCTCVEDAVKACASRSHRPFLRSFLRHQQRGCSVTRDPSTVLRQFPARYSVSSEPGAASVPSTLQRQFRAQCSVSSEPGAASVPSPVPRQFRARCSVSSTKLAEDAYSIGRDPAGPPTLAGGATHAGDVGADLTHEPKIVSRQFSCERDEQTGSVRL